MLIGDVVFVREEGGKGGTGVGGKGVGVVRVRSMGKGQAVTVLAEASGAVVSNDTRAEWEALVELVGRLPQALVLAGTYMRLQAVTAADMAQRVTQHMAQAGPLQAVVSTVLALPAFNASRSALLDLALLCGGLSSLPLVLVPPTFPVSLYAEYGLVQSTEPSVPYSHFHRLLFHSTESKVHSLHTLKAMTSPHHSPTTRTPSQHDLTLRLIRASALVDILALEALAFLHRPFHRDIHTRFDTVAPVLPPYPFPPIPFLSLSSFHALHSPSPASSTLIHSVFGPTSAPSAVAYSRAQAAAVLPTLESFLQPFRALHRDVTIRISSTGDVLEVTPQGVASSSALPVTPALVQLLHLAACYNADIRRDYPSAYRDLVAASALALQGTDDEALALSLLLLSVHHLVQNDTTNARSLLTFLHQRFLSPSSPASSALPVALQADILSALAVSHSMKGGDEAMMEPLFSSAMATRQQLTDRSALLHLLTCRDLLIRHPSFTLTSLPAHTACAHIETSVFGAHSYALATRSLALAHLHERANFSLACSHAEAAVAALQGLPSSPPDYRLPLAHLHLAHLLTLEPPSPGGSIMARSVLDSLFSTHSAHPRGAGVYSGVLLAVATEVLVRERDWLAAMDVVRQGYEVARSRGEGEDGWSRMYSFIYQRHEQEKAEERRQAEERERELQRQAKREAEQAAAANAKQPERTEL